MLSDNIAESLRKRPIFSRSANPLLHGDNLRGTQFIYFKIPTHYFISNVSINRNKNDLLIRFFSTPKLSVWNPGFQNQSTHIVMLKAIRLHFFQDKWTTPALPAPLTADKRATSFYLFFPGFQAVTLDILDIN